MSGFVGGDLLEVTCNHSALGNLRLQLKSNEDYEFHPGGYKANDDENGITGAGEPIDEMHRVRWFFGLPNVAHSLSSDELDKLAKLSAHPEPGIWTFGRIDGAIWSGKGRPVGDFSLNGNKGTINGVKISGGGVLTKI